MNSYVGEIVFYSLKENYALRGWKYQPMVMVDLSRYQISILSHRSFQALLLCDGTTDLNTIVTPELLEIIKQYEENGIVYPLSETRPLSQKQRYRYYDAGIWDIQACFCKIRRRISHLKEVLQ